ncbi:hypothetical protein [Aquimarina sp. SS2-1]|uniref:hypothetical protein n=1 Tax=Aquimarina besae TaxID=3342247 RepID=UPI00366B4155
MKNFIKHICFACILLCSFSNSFGQSIFYVTAQNGLILRDQPTTGGKYLGKLPFGTAVEVIKQTGKFSTILDGNDNIKGEWFIIDPIYPSGIDYDKELFVFGFYLQPQKDFIQMTRKKLT